MGTNKRYPNHAWELREQRIMREATPTTLTKRELALDEEPLTRSPKPITVLAWVRYRYNDAEEPIEVKAVMTAWTARAAAIEWETEAGQHRAWVWWSAVRVLR